MVKTFCDLCGQQMKLPKGMVSYGTKLPCTINGLFMVEEKDLCVACWTELQAWVDLKLMALKKLTPEDPKK